MRITPHPTGGWAVYRMLDHKQKNLLMVIDTAEVTIPDMDELADTPGIWPEGIEGSAIREVDRAIDVLASFCHQYMDHDVVGVRMRKLFDEVVTTPRPGDEGTSDASRARNAVEGLDRASKHKKKKKAGLKAKETSHGEQASA